MPEVMNIPSSARTAAGAFIAGAGLVGLVWVLTSRVPMSPPPSPEPVELWPTERDTAQTQPRVATQVFKPDEQPVQDHLEPEEPAINTLNLDGPVLVPIEPVLEPVVYPTSPIDAGPSTEAPTQPEPIEPEPQVNPGSAVQLISINTAGLAELQLLPRIGPVLAQRIIDDRGANGRFGSLKDLQRVKGIGEKTTARLDPLITFD